MSGNGKKKRIGVFVCHCGVNIASVVDVERVAKELEWGLPSQLTLYRMLNRLICA